MDRENLGKHWEIANAALMPGLDIPPNEAGKFKQLRQDSDISAQGTQTLALQRLLHHGLELTDFFLLSDSILYCISRTSPEHKKPNQKSTSMSKRRQHDEGFCQMFIDEHGVNLNRSSDHIKLSGGIISPLEGHSRSGGHNTISRPLWSLDSGTHFTLRFVVKLDDYPGANFP